MGPSVAVEQPRVVVQYPESFTPPRRQRLRKGEGFGVTEATERQRIWSGRGCGKYGLISGIHTAVRDEGTGVGQGRGGTLGMPSRSYGDITDSNGAFGVGRRGMTARGHRHVTERGSLGDGDDVIAALMRSQEQLCRSGPEVIDLTGGRSRRPVPTLDLRNAPGTSAAPSAGCEAPGSLPRACGRAERGGAPPCWPDTRFGRMACPRSSMESTWSTPVET